MKKDIFKRILSVIMAVILCTGMLGGFSAFAAGEQVENYQLAFPRRGDINYSDKWGHGKLKHMNGWFSDEAKYNTVFTIGSYSGPACYCIEPGTPIENKYKLTSRDESYWDNFPPEYNHTIAVPDIKIFIGRIMQYGYTGNVSINWRTQNEADADSFSLYYATQLLIWETVVGERDSDFNHITPVGCNAILDKIGAEHPMKSRIMSHYNNIVEGVKTHTTTPSFCSKTPSGGETRELKWDGSQYTATFTDTNNILQRFSFSADNGYTCRVAGNTLTVSGTAAPKGTVTVTAVKNTAGRKGIIVWGDGIVKPGVGQQDLATYAATVKDPVTAFLRLRVSTGNIKIVKTSEDGRVDGITFRIKGNGIDKTVKTANGGSITADNLTPGEYTVTEETPEEYAACEAQHITVASGQTATVSFNNILKKGKIAIIKHTDDGSTKIETPEKGAEFEVFLKSAGSYAGAKETERDILICDKNGFAETKALPYGEYTVKQTKGQSGRELIAPFNVFIREDGETYRFLINNAVFKSAVEIVKKDAETGKIIPAAGIGFKVRNTDTGKFVVQHITYPTPADIDTYYTDITGKLMLPEKLPYGNYEIIEQCTAYGYVLNTEPVAFKIDGSKTVVTVEKRNTPQKGIIRIQKSGEVFSSVNKSNGVYQPVFANKNLAGAVYEITAAEDIITPDGTLRYAKGTAVDTVTTDKKGNVESRPLYLGKYTVREIKAPYGMVFDSTFKTVELTYAGETVEVTETAIELYNQRQKAEVSLFKTLDKDEIFNIGNDGEILSVQFGLYAAEEMTAADGSSVPTDGLLEIANCDENGNITFKTDIPVGAKLYVKEIATDNHYILSDEIYPVTFEYAGQNTALVEIKANGGEAIKNDILYGSVKGLKIDRETESVIAGAKFGLFRSGETEFTAERAILTVESGEDGVFTFENIPYGDWLIKELQPADGYLANDEIYPVRIGENGQTIGITVVNDRIPEIKTTATVDGEKEICATEVFTLTDTVSYSHLIPGKEYVLKGALMDKNTGKAFTENGEAVTAETVFTPETPNGTVTISFAFDSRLIKKNTSLVVFETLYKDGKELAVHADIEDEDQTVKVTVPEIGTKATVNGEKSATAKGDITIEDTVSYKNLTVGKEYTVKGILMYKATGKPFLVNGKEVTSEVTFTAEKKDGEITVRFTFDGSAVTKQTDIVVFETLYRDGVEIAAHADIEHGGQTVTLTPPAPPVPQTGDNSNLGFWIGLAAVALGGVISAGIIRIKSRKDDDE